MSTQSDTVAFLLKRTAEREAAGVIPVYGGTRTAPPALPYVGPCSHRRGLTGETVLCGGCPGNRKIKVYACALHPGGCTLGTKVEGKHLCTGEPA
jgi:hypothetical protein